MTLDELVVKIVLDPSGFLSGQKATTDAADALKAKVTASATDAEKAQSAAAERARKAAEAEAKKVQAANEKTGESITAVGRKILGLYALFTAGRGIKDFISDITSSDAATGRLAKNLDMGVKLLSTWEGAARTVGGTTGGMAGFFSHLSGEMQTAALTGNNTLAPVFRALGINLADTSGKVRDMTAIMFDLNRVYNEQHIDPARFSTMMKMIGADDGTINLIELSTEKLHKLYDAQHKLALTPEEATAAAERQAGWENLLTLSTNLGREILTTLSPAIIGAMQAIKAFAEAHRKDLGPALKFVKQKLDEFRDWLNDPETKKALEAYGRQFLAFGHDVASIATAFAGVVATVSRQSPLAVAFEAFGALLALRILAPLTGILSTMRLIGGLPLTGALSLLTGAGGLAAAAVVASTSPLNAGEPTVGPDGRLTYPDGHSEAGRTWDGHTGHGAQTRDRAYHNQVDGRNAWQRTAPKWAGGKDAPGSDTPVPTDAHTPLKDLIAKHETGTTGTGGYETVYGHAERGGPLAPPKPITEMTLAQVLAYQREMKPRAGSPAFPVGRGQWVEKTLRGLTAKMDQNTKFYARGPGKAVQPIHPASARARSGRDACRVG